MTDNVLPFTKPGMVSGTATRFLYMKQLKNKQWVVVCVLDRKKTTRRFDTEHAANEFKLFLDSFISGKRKVVTTLGTEIQLLKCLYEMIDLQLKKGEITESSFLTYMSTMRSHLGGEFGLITLDQINEEYILRLKKSLEYNKNNKGWTGEQNLNLKSNGTSFNSVLVMLSKAKTHATKMGYRNISSEVDIDSYKIQIKPKEQKTHSLNVFRTSKKCFHDLTDKDERFYAGLLLVNMQMGLRIGELGALKWDDLDLIKNTITISKTLVRSISCLNTVKAGTKTDRDRTFPISTFIASYFLELKNYQQTGGYKPGENLECKDSDYIFIGSVPSFHNKPSSKPINVTTLSNWLRKGASILGIPYLNAHNACRKTMGTIVAKELSKSEDPFTVGRQIQLIMGHASLSMTMEKYIVPVLSEGNKAIDVFGTEEEKEPAA